MDLDAYYNRLGINFESVSRNLESEDYYQVDLMKREIMLEKDGILVGGPRSIDLYNRSGKVYDKDPIMSKPQEVRLLYDILDVSIKTIGENKARPRVLELASGTSLIGGILAYNHKNVDFVMADYSTGMLASANEKKKLLSLENVELVACDVENIPLPNGYFDFVYSTRPDWESDDVNTLVEVSRVMKLNSKWLEIQLNFNSYMKEKEQNNERAYKNHDCLLHISNMEDDVEELKSRISMEMVTKLPMSAISQEKPS